MRKILLIKIFLIESIIFFFRWATQQKADRSVPYIFCEKQKDAGTIENCRKRRDK
jgi:hypothetical protein